MNETRYLTAENVIIYVISQNLDFWKEHYKPQSGGYRIIFFSIAEIYIRLLNDFYITIFDWFYLLHVV